MLASVKKLCRIQLHALVKCLHLLHRYEYSAQKSKNLEYHKLPCFEPVSRLKHPEITFRGLLDTGPTIGVGLYPSVCCNKRYA